MLQERLFINMEVPDANGYKGSQVQRKRRMNDEHRYEEPRQQEEAEAEETVDFSSTTRDDDGSDKTPPMISPARGPMDQTVPDVPTGSTPLTRHDD